MAAMADAEGSLTPAQHEIMETVWNGPQVGMSVAEIWQSVCQNRDISRTTILNQVDRLEKRGWLRRLLGDPPIRFVATLDRSAASRRLAREFVDGFFAGSASELVMTLLDPKKLKPDEVRRLRKLLDDSQNQTDMEAHS